MCCHATAERAVLMASSKGEKGSCRCPGRRTSNPGLNLSGALCKNPHTQKKQGVCFFTFQISPNPTGWEGEGELSGSGCLFLNLSITIRSHRSFPPVGPHSTGAVSPCCMTNAYHGCPDCPEYSKELATQRRKEGIRPT